MANAFEVELPYGTAARFPPQFGLKSLQICADAEDQCSAPNLVIASRHG
jgi:hypothetical protein